MKKIKGNNYQLAGIILFFIFILMLILNTLTPIIADDFAYQFITGTTSKVNNLADVFISQYKHYFLWGGRTIAHILAQSFLIAPKYIFNIMNSFIYVLLIYLIYYLTTNRKNPLLLILIHFLIFYITPLFGKDYLWETGAFNYLWTTVIILLLLAYHKKNEKAEDSKLRIFLLFLVGIIAGWTNENTSFALLCILLIKQFDEKIIQKKSIQKWKIASLVGVLTGFILLISAPGNYIRASRISENTSFLIKYTKRLIDCTYGLVNYIPIILISILVLFTYAHYKKRKISTDFYSYFIGGIISVYVMIASPLFPMRAWSGIVIYFILAGMVIINDLKKELLLSYIIIDLLVIFSFIYILDYYALVKELKEYNSIIKYRENYIKKNSDQKTFKFQSYTSSNPRSPINGTDIFPDKETWENELIADYYGVEYIIGY